MRILYYCEQLHLMGGIERILTLKANELCRRGHELAIAFKNQGGEPIYYPLDDRIRTWDLSCSDYNAPQGFIALQRVRWQKYHILKERLQAVVDEFLPDIIVCPITNHYPILADLKGDFKTVLEFHASAKSAKSTDPLANRLMEFAPWRWLCRYILRKPSSWWRVAYRYYDRFVVLTTEDQKEWGELPNICVIPNALPVEMQGQSTLGSKVLLAVGRMTEQKDFASLIDIWSLIAGKYPEWRLRIVGGGYLHSALEAQVERLGLGTCVELLPADSNVQPYYLGASMFAMTSTFEGMPMTLLEAQALRLPIVSYSCPCGPRDIITDGVDGFLVPPRDKAMFAERLSQLIEDEELRLRMGAEAKKSSERYTPERIISQWEELFGDLLRR